MHPINESAVWNWQRFANLAIDAALAYTLHEFHVGLNNKT